MEKELVKITDGAFAGWNAEVVKSSANMVKVNVYHLEEEKPVQIMWLRHDQVEF